MLRCVTFFLSRSVKFYALFWFFSQKMLIFAAVTNKLTTSITHKHE